MVSYRMLSRGMEKSLIEIPTRLKFESKGSHLHGGLYKSWYESYILECQVGEAESTLKVVRQHKLVGDVIGAYKVVRGRAATNKRRNLVEFETRLAGWCREKA
jgi:hypothetical protein